jgi:hypothetical protein
MEKQNITKSLRLLFTGMLIAVLVVGMAPAQTARARATSSTSDLAVKILSMPTSAKACHSFRVKFSVTNRGPDPASHLYMIVMVPDPFSVIRLVGAPQSLGVGKTVTFSAIIKVVAFVPGESRKAWVGIDAMSDPYPDVSTDPNSNNNPVFRNMRLVSKPVMICP